MSAAMKAPKTSGKIDFPIPEAAIKRFWSRVTQGLPDDCWPFRGRRGGRSSFGYGLFYLGNSCIRAHRFSWSIAHGPIPDDLFVLHTCDNPPCVNPAHLWLGTVKDNAQDCLAKGRFTFNRKPRPGTKHHNAKLTEAIVAEIKQALREGVMQTELAAKHKVHKSTIWYIATGRGWRHVP